MVSAMERFTVEAIGHVRGGRRAAFDDDWGAVEAVIELDASRFTPDVVAGLDDFSHVDVVYVFDQVDEAAIHLGSRHPRGNEAWPRVGILAQRARARPNRIGVTTCELVGVDGLAVRVRGLDAIDATPVIDLKPYIVEFAPRRATHQPEWATALMAEYWAR
jgi:tRNA-Thr(GGU) m(6)t(6)A37 methyltransferase TsaA